MKKIYPKYTLVQELTEKEIKAIASNRWLNKHMVMVSSLLFVIAIISIIVSYCANDNIGVTVIAIGFAIGFAVFFYKYFKAGNKFWNSIEDKTQPIKFQEDK